jgi:hypothetical protein
MKKYCQVRSNLHVERQFNITMFPLIYKLLPCLHYFLSLLDYCHLHQPHLLSDPLPHGLFLSLHCLLCHLQLPTQTVPPLLVLLLGRLFKPNLVGVASLARFPAVVVGVRSRTPGFLVPCCLVRCRLSWWALALSGFRLRIFIGDFLIFSFTIDVIEHISNRFRLLFCAHSLASADALDC